MGLSGDEFDSFWDLSSMISNKPKNKTVTPSKEEISPTTEIPVGEADTTPKDTRISWSKPTEKLIAEYVPSQSPFLVKVCLYRVGTQYSFYSSFREDAIRYFGKKGQPTEPVPYFSYIPQYAQMTKAQLDFYFYFRERANEGEFILCDVSYFWLYVYEIINLPDRVPPKDGVRQMCLAWGAFRDSQPKIDKYMTVWLADYCLVNALPCPTESIGRFLPAILDHAGFKEFYLGHAKEHSIFGVHTLLSLVSSYQWQKSKFILSLSEAERKHILLALVDVIREIYNDSAFIQMSEEKTVMTRDAYTGSLCGHNIRCRIEVTYHAFHHGGKMSEVLTSAVKYAENKMRILHGQKSRLSVGDALLPLHKTIIDAYFDRITPKKPDKPLAKPTAEYERQYDATEESVSFAKALSIEDDSWENTRKLVDGTAEGEEQDTILDLSPVAPAESKETPPTESKTESREREVLSLLLEKGSIPCDFELIAVCEDINSRFASDMGDIVIAITDTECTLIEDYREDIESWLKTQ